jgi:GR25 family glycosyltransferase involved in LPS biosynthesis
MDNYLLKKANNLFRKDDYENSTLYYRKLIQKYPYFKKFIQYNIILCDKKLNNYLKNYNIDTSTSKKDIKRNFGENCFLKSQNLLKNWEGWKSSPNIFFIPDGNLKCMFKDDVSCVSQYSLPVLPDTYYKFDFTYKTSSNSTNLFWIIRKSDSSSKVNYYNDNQAPVIMNKGSSLKVKASIIFRSFCNTTRIDLHLYFKSIFDNDWVQIENIFLTKLDPIEACPPVSILENEKIIASLASIPTRKDILKDVIRSLYYQVDEIRIFLNGYEKIPPFLRNDKKISYERSQIHGDNGDAGKFFWSNDTTPGYRFICDDDIIFPPNYVYRMIRKLKQYQDKVIVGTHGILLKQPIDNYYDPSQRFVFHYRGEKRIDASCHVLGTGAIAYRNGSFKINYKDFHYPNMGDIWLSKLSKEQKIPLVCISSPDNWIMPQDQEIEESIYNHSTLYKSTKMNTLNIQTSVVKELYPLTILPREKTRPKAIFSIKTYNRCDYLKECINSFLATRSNDFDWSLIIADDGSCDETLEYLKTINIPHEIHIIKNHRKYAVGQCNTIFRLSMKLDFDIGFQVDDDVYFINSGWDKLYFEAVKNSRFDHLCFLHKKHFIELQKKHDIKFQLPTPNFDNSGLCVSYTNVNNCMGAFFTFTKKMIEVIGGADEINFPIRGQWHIDLSVRACRAGFNNANFFYDLKNSNDFIKLQNDKVDKEYKCSIPWGENYKKTKEINEINRRLSLISDESRLQIPLSINVKGARGKTVNSFFDKVYVLNLDRRPDRWKRVYKQAKQFGIDLYRYAAVDGYEKPYIEQYREYLQQPFTKVPKRFATNSSFEFYRNYPTYNSRIAYFENHNKRKAIGSPGAWGYLLTMISILKDSMKHDYEQILVLDDDVIFHKNFNELFKKIIVQIPHNWTILQLGCLQYNWDEKWINWYTDNLYICNGCSLGSHAVGMHRSIIPLVLHYCQRFDLPYDEGPLHIPKAWYSNKCLTFYPNLLIQDVTESDISDKTKQKKAMSQKDNVFRWDLEKYILK